MGMISLIRNLVILLTCHSICHTHNGNHIIAAVGRIKKAIAPKDRAILQLVFLYKKISYYI